MALTCLPPRLNRRLANMSVLPFGSQPVYSTDLTTEVICQTKDHRLSDM